MLRSYSYTHSLSSATWYLGPVPIPVPMVPIPMVPYPYPYPYLWSRTHTRTRTHDFVTCHTRTHTRTHGLVPVPVPIPMVSNPYPYPYPWPRTHTRTHTTSLAHRCSDSYFDLKKHVVCIKMLLFRTVSRTSKLGHDRLAWCRQIAYLKKRKKNGGKRERRIRKKKRIFSSKICQLCLLQPDVFSSPSSMQEYFHIL